jgi:hypothetical protein
MLAQPLKAMAAASVVMHRPRVMAVKRVVVGVVFDVLFDALEVVMWCSPELIGPMSASCRPHWG